MPSQTGSIDLKSQAVARNNSISVAASDATSKANAAQSAAEKVATNYISVDPIEGIRIANSTPDAAPSYQRQTATKTEFVVDNISVSSFGEEIRIGQLSNGHAIISGEKFDYIYGETSVFSIEAFGDSVYTKGTVFSDEYVVGAHQNVSVSWTCSESDKRNNPKLIYRDNSVTGTIWRLVADGTETIGDALIYYDVATVSTSQDNTVYTGTFRVVNDSSASIVVVFAEIFEHRSVKTRLGKKYDSNSTSNENYVEIDYHSLNMIDKNNNSYFYISDLRNANNEAELEETFLGDGSTKIFTVGFDISAIVSATDSSHASNAYGKYNDTMNGT